MKRTLIAVLAVMFIAASAVGCGQQKASSSSEAISRAEMMESMQAKKDYLVGQAKAFYNSDEFQQAVDVAQYILKNLDKDSAEAKQILEDAKSMLQQKMQEGMDSMGY